MIEHKDYMPPAKSVYDASDKHVHWDGRFWVADPAPDALEQLIDVEDRDRLRRLLAVLPANDREFMERCLDDDADVQRVSENSCKW